VSIGTCFAYLRIMIIIDQNSSLSSISYLKPTIGSTVVGYLKLQKLWDISHNLWIFPHIKISNMYRTVRTGRYNCTGRYILETFHIWRLNLSSRIPLWDSSRYRPWLLLLTKYQKSTQNKGQGQYLVLSCFQFGMVFAIF